MAMEGTPRAVAGDAGSHGAAGTFSCPRQFSDIQSMRRSRRSHAR